MKTVIYLLLAFGSATMVSQTPLPDLPDLGRPGYSCPGLMTKSRDVPTSAHSVRPADIKVIGALGDSLTAANGAGAYEALAVYLEYRGLSFPIGGDKSLDEHITVANVLKKYNPNVFGWSKGIGSVNLWSAAQLNRGVPGAHAHHLPGQARDLIQKMQAHPELVDIQNDWKLVTIHIGGNDMCAYCKDQTEDAATFAGYIQEAVQILYDNLPRTIVSVLGMFQMQMLRQIDSGQMFCKGLHVFECGCESHNDFTNDQMQAACISYQQAQMAIQNSGVFDQRDDFTFVIQPVMFNITIPPLLPDGSADLSFFAPDCFHFSQYGHAMVALGLWNNMMQPVGGKDVIANLSDPTIPLACPDPTCPFIRTTKNSRNCQQFVTPAMTDTKVAESVQVEPEKAKVEQGKPVNSQPMVQENLILTKNDLKLQ